MEFESGDYGTPRILRTLLTSKTYKVSGTSKTFGTAMNFCDSRILGFGCSRTTANLNFSELHKFQELLDLLNFSGSSSSNMPCISGFGPRCNRRPSLPGISQVGPCCADRPSLVRRPSTQIKAKKKAWHPGRLLLVAEGGILFIL